MNKRLSLSQKRRYLDIIIARDGGFKCFYCEVPLTLKTGIFEHLNDKWTDNHIDNLVLACQSCNVKKKDDRKLSYKATCKIEELLNNIFVREKNFENPIQEASKEIDINMSNSAIVEQHITETIQTDGSIEFADALDSCVYLCKKKTGHGSQQSVRNYIAALTSSVGPFMMIRDENKKKIIVKRSGN